MTPSLTASGRPSEIASGSKWIASMERRRRSRMSRWSPERRHLARSPECAYSFLMDSLPALDTGDSTPPPAREDTQRLAIAKDRAKRLAEAHAWVLEHHAETFEKLAK